MDLLQQIFELCIVPLLGILTAYIVKLIQKKNAEIDSAIDEVIVQKYVDMLSNTIKECVVSTNQTYVDALKNQNAFTKEAQEKAFELTYQKVMNILTEDAKKCLTEAYGDLGIYITTKIESEVSFNKKEVQAQ